LPFLDPSKGTNNIPASQHFEFQKTPSQTPLFTNFYFLSQKGLYIFLYGNIITDMPRSPTTTDAFNAIAEARRREIIGHLMDQERSVNDLVDSMGIAQPQVSKHLRVLREVGLVNVRQDGKRRWYSLDANQLKPVYDWVQTFERFWDHQLSGVKALAEAKVKAEQHNKPKKKKDE
ncbi:MAG: metalloregulator ArsR/SmtB family transcription factor, partial [Gimesia sp.]